MIAPAMNDTRTTAIVQNFLNELALKGDSSPDTIVRSLLASAVDRLHLICTTLLFRSYPRLTRPPLNLQADEMLSSVVERLLKAMREVHPKTVRQFFALANQHIRWELNDLCRRLDKETQLVELRESQICAPADSLGSQISPNTERILDAIENLPHEEREAFELVRIQGLSQPEAAEVLGVSTKTVQRRLVRCLSILTGRIGDLRPGSNNPA